MKKSIENLFLFSEVSDMAFKQHMKSCYKISAIIIIFSIIVVLISVLIKVFIPNIILYKNITFHDFVSIFSLILSWTLIIISYINIKIHNKTWYEAKVKYNEYLNILDPIFYENYDDEKQQEVYRQIEEYNKKKNN